MKTYFSNISENHFACKSSVDKVLLRQIQITEINHHYDQRADFFEPANKKGLDGLAKREIWKVIDRKSIHPNSNLLRGRFVIAINDEETQNVDWKARLIVQRHLDEIKKLLVHDIVVVKQFTTKIVVGLARMVKFDIFSTDANQRNINLELPKELKLRYGQVLKLLKPFMIYQKVMNSEEEPF